MGLPKQVQDFIKNNNPKYVKNEFSYSEDASQVMELTIDLVENIINTHYNKSTEEVGTSLYNFLIEPLRNSNYYSLRGTENKGTLELYLTSKTLVAGYFDGGDYFKKEDVKDCWENRVSHREKAETGISGIGGGAGMKTIYHFADLIFVDNLEGKLYTGINFENNEHFSRLFGKK